MAQDNPERIAASEVMAEALEPMTSELTDKLEVEELLHLLFGLAAKAVIRISVGVENQMQVRLPVIMEPVTEAVAAEV